MIIDYTHILPFDPIIYEDTQMLTVTMVYIAVITTSCSAAQGCTQFWFILSNNIAVHCILSGEYPNLCIYTLNNIPAPTLTNMSMPLSDKSCASSAPCFCTCIRSSSPYNIMQLSSFSVPGEPHDPRSCRTRRGLSARGSDGLHLETKACSQAIQVAARGSGQGGRRRDNE